MKREPTNIEQITNDLDDIESRIKILLRKQKEIKPLFEILLKYMEKQNGIS